MRYLLFLMMILPWACTDSKGPVSESDTASKHSKEFNQSMQSVLNDYYKLSGLFVEWDSSALSSAAGTLIKSIDNISFGNDTATNLVVKKSTPILNKDLNIITEQTVSLEQKRRAFNSFTQNLYALLEDVQYDEKKLYLQECPMAFNDTEHGVWLSAEDSIRNPYLGLRHPRYGSAMLECGGNKSTIDFTSTRVSRSEKKSEEKNTTQDDSKSKEKKD